MTKKRLHVVVSGRVQGVFFRHYTQLKAQELELAGWVRNCSDGTVETVFEGQADQAEKMLVWLHTGSPGARVSQVSVREETCTGDTADFIIRY